MIEHVVLVNDQDEVLGTADKALVHHDQTPLHRGFSLFIGNTKGEVLLQKRHSQKKTWPGFWSNSCCGHPQEGESYEQAVSRRTHYELGITLEKIEFIAPYRYRCAHQGIVEHEICPIFWSTYDASIHPHPEEVEAIQWMPWATFFQAIQEKRFEVTPWCLEESVLVNAYFEKA